MHLLFDKTLCFCRVFVEVFTFFFYPRDLVATQATSSGKAYVTKGCNEVSSKYICTDEIILYVSRKLTNSQGKKFMINNTDF